MENCLEHIQKPKTSHEITKLSEYHQLNNTLFQFHHISLAIIKAVYKTKHTKAPSLKKQGLPQTFPLSYSINYSQSNYQPINQDLKALKNKLSTSYNKTMKSSPCLLLNRNMQAVSKTAET